MITVTKAHHVRTPRRHKLTRAEEEMLAEDILATCHADGVDAKVVVR